MPCGDKRDATTSPGAVVGDTKVQMRRTESSRSCDMIGRPMTRTPPTATTIHGSPAAVVHRLIDALNRGDLEGMLDCFDPDVRIELPTQPDRAVHGREYLRAYWQEALEGAGEIRARLMRCATDGDTVLTEWCWYGTRRDGSSFARAGMTVQGIVGGRIAWQRVYMEPVRGDPETVGAWIVTEMASRRLG